MKKYIKILIPVLIAFSSLSNTTSAQSLIDVSFNPNPLFSASNFMPGDDKTAGITVGNNTESSQNAYVEAVNVSNDDNLANQMQLQILEGATEIYSDSFGTFLNAGPVSLSTIGASGSKTYNLKISFLENTGNTYQGKTLGFDICVGFRGGNQTCTNTTTVGPEQNPGGGGGGGGGSSGNRHLIIFNENVSNISASGIVPESGQATVSWNTNIPATSQVIYGPASGAPYPFDINMSPKFGYPLVNVEDLSKTVDHSMVLTSLTPGVTYLYRVVSRASPPTISYEHEFTVPYPEGGAVALGSETIVTTESGGEILGASTQNEKVAEAASSTVGSKVRANLAAAFTSGWGDLISSCSLVALLILLLAYLIWKFLLRPRYEERGLSEKEIDRKFWAFFGLFALVSVLVAILLKQYCPVPVFLLAFVISAVGYVYKLVK